MSAPKGSDAEFVELVRKFGVEPAAKKLGVSPRQAYRRKRNLERKYQRPITPPDTRGQPQASEHPEYIQLKIKDGVVLIGSDAHLWPGPLSTAMRAFIKFCKDFKPKAVIMNGDVCD